MTLIVETGSGASDSESYISVADATTRHTAFGNTAWTGSDAVKEAALRRATAHIEQAYRGRFIGTRLTRDQALSWPRYGVSVDGYDVPSTIVPAELANACADLAVRALTETLAPDQTRGVLRKKIGPLETEYDPNSPQAKRFTAIDRMLAPYLTGSGVMVQVVRT